MSQKIRKAVIPAAGLGTRFLPATKAIPKEMLPIVDKPVIQYVVEGLVRSGIEQIVIVTGWHKRTIEDHFDYPFELEYRLKQAGKEELYEAQRKIADSAEFIYVRQREPLGNGHAILQAKSVIGDEPFFVQWGDDIVINSIPLAQQLMTVYKQYTQPVLAVMKIPDHDISKYGIIDPENINDKTYKVNAVIEKPTRQESPSNLALVTGFILTPNFFEYMATVKPGKGGELWYIDAIHEMIKNSNTVYAHEFSGIRYDCGHKLGYLQANIDLALKRDDIGEHLKHYLIERLKKTTDGQNRNF